MPDLSKFEPLNHGYDVVFHIGAPKTGTSAIQKYLLENRQALKTSGFFYPEHSLDENGVSGGHSSFGLNIKQGNLPAARAVLETWISAAKQLDLTLLVSAESLYFHPEKLKDIAPKNRCKILAFYRNPMDNIYSNYNQSVKRLFATATFEQFCENFLQADSDYYSGRLFSQWIESFGKDNVLAVGYAADLFDALPIQTLFLRMLGLSEQHTRALTPASIQYVNRCYSPDALELKRLLNHVLTHDHSMPNQQIDLFLQKLSDESAHRRGDITSLLSTEISRRFIQKYQYPAQQLMEKYLTPINPISAGTDMPDMDHATAKTQEPVDMQDILTRFKSDKPDLYEYVITQTIQAIKSRRDDQSLAELAEILHIGKSEPG